MVLREQAMRNWRLAAIVSTTGTAIYSVLYAEYEAPAKLPGRKHVFSDLQESYRNWIDKHIWGIDEPLPSSSSSSSSSS
eukprot:CAMPEP_0116557154 /NCGR_PEP_ID=MMETSP0397-20121206/9080_1 /TAXON_ID=216820 /ORGANISM="Cyclophora tenuis, Strain ECT3854" /LENGTH=78 /DNA_ID=CAMNT_0004082575 /DNA_START=39 /DNA_END=271 /DNA_ORIENTATION=+